MMITLQVQQDSEPYALDNYTLSSNVCENDKDQDQVWFLLVGWLYFLLVPMLVASKY